MEMLLLAIAKYNQLLKKVIHLFHLQNALEGFELIFLSWPRMEVQASHRFE